MKIVKEGNWNVPWSTEAVCQTCEATVLVEAQDVKPRNESGEFYWICMACYKSNVLASKDVAPSVRESSRFWEAVRRQFGG